MITAAELKTLSDKTDCLNLMEKEGLLKEYPSVEAIKVEDGKMIFWVGKELKSITAQIK